MVDMPDYAHPTIPDPWRQGLAVNQLQSYFDNQRLQQDTASAGQLAGAGDYQGASSQLLGQGHFAQAMQMQQMLRSAKQDQLDDYKDTHDKLGNLAEMAAGDPDTWNRGLAALGQAGLPVQNYQGEAGRLRALAEAKMGAQAVQAEHIRRADELAMLKFKADQADDGSDTTKSTIWHAGPPPVLGMDSTMPYGFTVNKRTGLATPVKEAPGARDTGEAAPAIPPPAPPSLGGGTPISMRPDASAINPAATAMLTKGGAGEEGTPLNEAAIAALPEGYQNKVRQAQKGEVLLNPRSKEDQQLMPFLYSYDKNYSARDAEARYNFRKKFMDANVSGSNSKLVNFATMIDHGIAMDRNLDALPDTGSLDANQIKNWFAAHTTDPNLNNFKINANMFSGEADKLVSGGNPTQAGHQEIYSTLDPSLGGQTLRAGAGKYIGLAYSKAHQMVKNWESNMQGIPFPEEIMPAQTWQALKALKSKYVGLGVLGAKDLPEGDEDVAAQNAGAPTRSAAPPAAGAVPEGTIQRNKTTGAQRIMKGGQWHPLP